MSVYVVIIKPGVYYIDRGYSPLTNSETYDLTDDINKATKYTETSYKKAKKHAKRVYGKVNKMTENHKIENYKDQIKLLEVDLDMANENKKMFYRLWIRWANESRDIERAIHRLKDQIKNTPQ